jgi:collagen triple helix repeat protein
VSRAQKYRVTWPTQTSLPPTVNRALGQQLSNVDEMLETLFTELRRIDGMVSRAGGIGAGDVFGPAGATDAALPLFDGTTGKLLKDSGVAISSLAPLESPAFTDTPTAPTAAPGTSTAQLATTAFVAAAGGGPGSMGPPGMPGLDGLAGEDGWPGPPGAAGSAGVAGSAGPPGVPGLDGEDGIDGRPGPVGATGATGLIGPPGLDGETVDEPLIIPGPVGAVGPMGLPGPPGMDGDPAEDGWILPYPKELLGVWITVPYASCTFSATGTMTWTVDAGDFDPGVFYTLFGRTLLLSWNIAFTTVAAPLSYGLKMAVDLPGINTTGKVLDSIFQLQDNLTLAPGICQITATTPKLNMVFYKIDISNWSAATNNTIVRGQLAFEVI